MTDIDQCIINSCARFGRNFSRNGSFKNVIGKGTICICYCIQHARAEIEMSYSIGEIKSQQKAVGNDE